MHYFILRNQKQIFKKSRTFIIALLDFHALTTSIMKFMLIFKGNPKIKFYRDYENFDEDLFQFGLASGLKNLSDSTYASFGELFLRAIDYHAPIKKKVLRANKNFFMSKALCKVIMLHSRMKNLHL